MLQHVQRWCLKLEVAMFRDSSHGDGLIEVDTLSKKGESGPFDASVLVWNLTTSPWASLVEHQGSLHRLQRLENQQGGCLDAERQRIHMRHEPVAIMTPVLRCGDPVSSIKAIFTA